MNTDLLTGKLVRLVAVDPLSMAEYLVSWSRDSEYWRLLAADPVRPFTVKATQKWIESFQNNPGAVMFGIQTLENDQLIGEIDLDGISLSHRDAFVGIGIGERGFWSRGYGTDAMSIMLRYAFRELTLHRVSLTVFAYNPRAIRSYEKAGFCIEGRVRQFIHREGQYWDMVFMGITRSNWVDL